MKRLPLFGLSKADELELQRFCLADPEDYPRSITLSTGTTYKLYSEIGAVVLLRKLKSRRKVSWKLKDRLVRELSMRNQYEQILTEGNLSLANRVMAENITE